MSQQLATRPAVPPAPPRPLTFTQWLIILMAVIGFTFDTYQLLMVQFIVRPALFELGNIRPGTPAFANWFSLIFYVPAACGGIFGLLGGYLTDRLGRRRVLIWSILLYAVSAFAAGFATSLWMLLALRCLTFIGFSVEFVAAVAWLAELFPEPERREKVLGYTQAFASIGGFLVALVYGWAVQWADRLPAIALPGFLASWMGHIAGSHADWRYTLISGLIPAIPLIVIRPFLPESPVWQQRKAAGTLKRASFRELFQPALRRTTIVTTIMVACSYGAALGAIQQMPQIAPGLPAVQKEAHGKPPPKQAQVARAAAAHYGKIQEVGGLVGRFLLALLVVAIASRRSLLRVFQIPGLLLMPLVYAYAFTTNTITLFSVGTWEVNLLEVGVFFAGLVTVAQFSFWGNYLPSAYPVHLRGTGEGFAANIGGRLIGTGFAAVTAQVAVMSFWPGDYSAPAKVATAAAVVALFVYLVGSIACFFLPEQEANAVLE